MNCHSCGKVITETEAYHCDWCENDYCVACMVPVDSGMCVVCFDEWVGERSAK